MKEDQPQADIVRVAPPVESRKNAGTMSFLDSFDKIGKTIGGFGVGVAKSFVQAPIKAAKFGAELGQRASAALRGSPFEDMQKSMSGGAMEAATAIPESLKPQGSAEKVGEAVGEIGQTLLPTGIAAKGEKIAGLISKGSKLTQAATKTGLRVGADIADIATKAPFVTGDVGETEDQLLWTGLLGVPLRGAQAAKEAIGGDVASRIVNSLIKPGKRDFSFGKNPGKAIAEEGITAGSFDELEQAVDTRVKEYGSKIGDAIKNMATEKVDGKQILSSIDDALVEAKKSPRVNAPRIQRLQDIKDDLVQKSLDDTGMETIGRNFEDMTVEEAFALKQDIAALTKFTGNPTDDELVNKALKSAYGRTKEIINEKVPGVRDLNEKYADLLSARTAVKNRANVAERNNLVSLPSLSAGGGAATAMALLTGAAAPAAIAGLGATALMKVAGTPAFKTNAAKWLAAQGSSGLLELYKVSPQVAQLLLEAASGDTDIVNQD